MFTVSKTNKSIKQENLQLAVFTAFNILASYKFPLIEALGVWYDIRLRKEGRIHLLYSGIHLEEYQDRVHELSSEKAPAHTRLSKQPRITFSGFHAGR